MSAKIYASQLLNDAHWRDLENALHPSGKLESVTNIVSHLRLANARSVLVEEEYLDRDFTDEFSKFYSTVFRRYQKTCKRYHFFDNNVGDILQETQPQRLAERLEDAGEKGHYLGFIVVRPLSHAPLGRVVLVAPTDPDGMRSHLLAKAKFHVHFLGAELSIVGSIFTQQDSRVGACAQAAIWAAGRLFYETDHGPWFSTADITAAASKPTDSTVSQSLPAGSGGLNINNMLRALHAMDREPLSYMASKIDSVQDPILVEWEETLKPHEVIYRYVDSGIPVILVLAPWANDQGMWHAVVAVGHTLREHGEDHALPRKSTRAEFCECFLVNDDQRGTTLRMPISANCSIGQTPYCVDKHVAYIIAPLPRKVFIQAEAAEQIAWELLDLYRKLWDVVKQNYPEISNSIAGGDRFCDLVEAGAIVARTYLTNGWEYKRRLLRSSIGSSAKQAIIRQDLPRYVWITEFSDFGNLNSVDPTARRILSHSVIDGTSSNFWHGVSLFHGPGLVSRWYHDSGNPYGDYLHEVSIVADESPYEPRILR